MHKPRPVSYIGRIGLDEMPGLAQHLLEARHQTLHKTARQSEDLVLIRIIGDDDQDTVFNLRGA